MPTNRPNEWRDEPSAGDPPGLLESPNPGPHPAAGAGEEAVSRNGTEDELRWKTALFEAQLDAAPDGILVVDTHGEKILQNRRHRALWKVPPRVSDSYTEQLQFFIKQAKHPEEFLKTVAHLYTHPDEVFRDEIELVDGRILDRYTSPVRDPAGKHYGRIWIVRDITEQRKLEAQHRQSEKMDAVGRLAGGVAHHFNNTLAAILLQAGMLKSVEHDPAGRVDFARKIEQAAQRAAHLVRQLLLLSSQETNRPLDLRLNEVVTEVLDKLQQILGENIQMQVNFAAQPLLVHADASLLDQVLFNLAANARDAMSAGGRFIIETSAVEFDAGGATHTFQARPGSFARLAVTDTGCGIPPEILPRIFEPFFTTKSQRTEAGLGLAVVYGIVQQLEGWINVQTKVGRGTTFQIYVPRQPRPQSPYASGSSRP